MALKSYAEALKTDKNLNEYIKQRKGLDKSSNEYKVLQNKINAAYGSSKRYKIDESPSKPVGASPQSGNRAVGSSSSISSLTSPTSLKTDLDAALASKFGKNTDVQKQVTNRMSLMAGGNSSGSSTTGQQFDKPYQSATTHTDATGTTITNLKGKPGQTRDRAIIGGPAKGHSDAIASAGKTGNFKSTKLDLDNTDYAAKLAADEGAYNTKMQKQQKRETIAGLGSKKEFRQAKREGILTGKDRKAAKQAIAQNKGDIAFNKSLSTVASSQNQMASNSAPAPGETMNYMLSKQKDQYL